MRTVVCIALLLSSTRLFSEVSGAPLPSETEFKTEEEVGRENDPFFGCPGQGEWATYTTGDQPSLHRIPASVTPMTLAMSSRTE